MFIPSLFDYISVDLSIFYEIQYNAVVDAGRPACEV